MRSEISHLSEAIDLAFKPETASDKDMNSVVTEAEDEASDDNGENGFSNDNEFNITADEDRENDEIGEEESFAANFYRSGTDWSCLLPGDADDDNSSNVDLKRKLKQSNLLEVWGLKKQNPIPIPIPKALPLASMSQPPLKRLKVGSSSIEPKRSIKNCPFYKRIPGTPFSVDAFRYGPIRDCSAYFLTHFHADHYGGLTKGWSYGPIHCTHLTARLLKLCLYVNSSFIHPLEINTEYVIEGVRVTLLEANHCPDHKVNVLYLDTTYCNPTYKFPSKEDVLSYVVKVTKDFLRRQPRTLVVVGAYSIGKECVYLAISKALGVKIYASASRRRVLESFGWPDLSRSLCTKPEDTLLHVLPISFLKVETLKDYLKKCVNQPAAVLAFRPTGWTFSESIGKQLDLIRPISKGNVTIYGVPYSEHSSFTELKEFVQFLKPDKIIPTVNVGNPTNRDKMQSYFKQWLQG